MYPNLAGRTRPVPWAYKRDGCVWPSFFGEGRCGDPVCGSLAANGARLRGCLLHLNRLGIDAGRDMTWHCSSCLRRVERGWQLDSSGRCLRCQP